jgi:hypothetical protein
MTIPSERTRALILAEQFLQKLRLSDATPDEIRENAIFVLRHFPNRQEIESEAKYQMVQQRDALSPPWLLPMDYYKLIEKARKEKSELPTTFVEDIKKSIKEDSDGKSSTYILGKSEP